MYPTQLLTTITQPDYIATNTLAASNNATRLNKLRDEIIGIETKLGIDGSSDNTTVDFKLSEVAAGDKVISKTATQTLTNKTLVSPKINTTGDSTGDMYYRGVTGALERIPIGANGQQLNVVGGVPAFASASGQNNNYIADTGAANVYIATLVPAIGAYVAGQLVQFKASNTNTGSSTLNVNGIGPITIKKNDGTTNLVSGDIVAGQIVEVEYDGANFQMLSPSAKALNSDGDGSALTGIIVKDISGQTFMAARMNGGTATDILFAASTTGVTSTEPFFTLTQTSSGSAPYLARHIKKDNGSIYTTHNVNQSGAGAYNLSSICVVGNYVYSTYYNGASMTMNRYDKDTLANAVAMTVSGTAIANNTMLFTNGTDIYSYEHSTGGAVRVYTISGTTITSGSTVSYTSLVTTAGYWSDGTTLYANDSGNTYKWSMSGGARTTGPIVVSSQYIRNTSLVGRTNIFKVQGVTTELMTFGASPIGASGICSLISIPTF